MGLLRLNRRQTVMCPKPNVVPYMSISNETGGGREHSRWTLIIASPAPKPADVALHLNSPSPFGQINNPNAKGNGGDTQTEYVLALHMNLMPEMLRTARCRSW
jgi:hypothetical protein